MRYHQLEKKTPSTRHDAPEITSAERFRIALAVARERVVVCDYSRLNAPKNNSFKCLHSS